MERDDEEKERLERKDRIRILNEQEEKRREKELVDQLYLISLSKKHEEEEKQQQQQQQKKVQEEVQEKQKPQQLSVEGKTVERFQSSTESPSHAPVPSGLDAASILETVFGFEHDRILWALQEASGDVNRALSTLHSMSYWEEKGFNVEICKRVLPLLHYSFEGVCEFLTKITFLMELGYSETMAASHLITADFDVQKAAHLLFQQST